MFLIILITVAVAFWYLDEYFRRRGKPPGPLKFPLLGSLIQLQLADPVGYIALDKISRKYGPVVSLRLGFMDTVLVSSHESIKYFYSLDEATARNYTGVLWDRNYKQNLGIVLSNGQSHDEMRKFASKCFRKYGFLTESDRERLILDELTHLIEQLHYLTPTPQVLNFHELFYHPTFANLVVRMTTGKRMDVEDPDFKALIAGDEKFFKSENFGAFVMTAYPFLRTIFPTFLGYKSQMEATEEMHHFPRQLIKKTRNCTISSKEPTSFTEEFISRIDEAADLFYTEKQFIVVFSDLIQAGTDALANFMLFATYFLSAYPKVQEKVYEEIFSVIGTRTTPSLLNRNKMEYTVATIAEIHRLGRIANNLVPRMLTSSVTYNSYRIEKGTMILANLHSAFMDERVWNDPQVFRPERFLGPTGAILREKVHSIAFGAGKRMCFGYKLANDASFLTLSSLIQKFQLSIDGNSDELKIVAGFNNAPAPFRVLVKSRRK